jgi:predicted Rossmann fold nucleotide-binding protein DprA/Smf involved in DNA uptake
MADSLERAVMNREQRDMIVGGRLTLVSPYDPRAGFNVGNAMQRNKVIYALADAALVVNSDMGKGGTWAGAVEQLDKLHLVPVYVRSTGNQPPAFAALQKKGALPWPNPADAEALERVLAEPRHAATPMPETQKNLFSESNHAGRTDTAIDADRDSSDANRYGVAEASRMHLVEEPAPNATSHSVAPNNVPVETPEADGAVAATATPAEVVFNGARVAVRELLSAPMQAPDIAKALDVSPAQANAWLKRLVEEGSIERLRSPVRYVVKSQGLFGPAQSSSCD